MNEHIKFSIVVPVFREKPLIAYCLDSIQKLHGSERAEVVVVDGDGGSTLEGLKIDNWSMSIRTVVTEPGRGIQLDTGARLARGEILVFLHVDTRLPRKGLILIESALARAGATAFDLYLETKSYLVPHTNRCMILGNGRSPRQ